MAILRVNILAASLPGDYVVASQETGDKIVLSLWGPKATTEIRLEPRGKAEEPRTWLPVLLVIQYGMRCRD